MSLKIVRWRGCHRGDMLLQVVTHSNPDIKTNVKFRATLEYVQGTTVDFSDIDYDSLKNYERICLPYNTMKQLDPDELQNELEQLDSDQKTWCIKSHYYNSSQWDSCTVDLTVDCEYLPLVVNGNIETGETLNCDYNPLIAKINDPAVLKKYSLYNVAKDCMAEPTASPLSIQVFVNGWQTFRNSIETLGVQVVDSSEKIYQSWLDQNKKYFPSTTYRNMILEQNYDFNCPELTMTERYCMLVLSGKKFQVLKEL